MAVMVPVNHNPPMRRPAGCGRGGCRLAGVTCRGQEHACGGGRKHEESDQREHSPHPSKSTAVIGSSARYSVMSDPALAPLAASFGRVAEAYDRGRPSYPPEALRWLTSGLGLTTESTVLDLAAGTGKLTAGLRPLVGRVIAVEPVAEMRRVLQASQPQVDGARRHGRGDPTRGGRCRRSRGRGRVSLVQRRGGPGRDSPGAAPGGGLGLLWNRPEWDAEPWYADFAAVRERARAAQGSPPNLYSVGSWRAALEGSPLYGPVHKREFRHVQRVGREEFLARVASWSVVAVLPDERRSEVLAEVGEMLAAHGMTTLDLRYRTDTYRTRAIEPTARAPQPQPSALGE